MDSLLITDLKTFFKDHGALILRDARLRGRMLRWGGRFQIGRRVPVGTAVLYLDKVLLSFSDDRDPIPAENARGWVLLVNLAHMRLEEFPLAPDSRVEVKNDSVKNIVTTRMINYAVDKFYHRVKQEPVVGLVRWRGIFEWETDYSKDDFVAYDKSIYVATSGMGVPGGSDGWNRLDGLASKGKELSISVPSSPVVTHNGEEVTYTGDGVTHG